MSKKPCELCKINDAQIHSYPGGYHYVCPNCYIDLLEANVKADQLLKDMQRKLSRHINYQQINANDNRRIK